ncbi:MAG: hypothetical protein ABJB40_05685 [Acidobacteriota bacterium]
MRNVKQLLLLAVLVVGSAIYIWPQEKPVTRLVGRYTLLSNPWVNLHQRLMYAARFEPAAPAVLNAEDLAKWNAAVDAYKVFMGKRHPIFDEELIGINDDLSAATTLKLPKTIPPAAAKALESVMPLYRQNQWPEDDRINRFCMSIAEPLLASAAEELADATAKAYGVAFPTHIRVDFVSHGWQFGAYTVGSGDTAHVVLQSTDPANQGFRVLEALIHEPSHAMVGDGTKDVIGSDLARISKDLDVRPMANLWHAILFYTAGELTRQALAHRGVPDYKPIITLFYAGPFRGYQASLEKHWQSYLDGKITRDAALREILLETSPAKK